MSDEWAPAPKPKAPRRWPRRLLWTACGLVVFLFVAYFVVTSHFFLESFILPRVNTALHATVTVADSSIGAFSHVSLRNVKIKTSVMEDPLLSAKEIRARYSLFSIIGGNINVDEVTIDSPVIQIVQYADGSKNIDRVLKGFSSSPSAAPAKPGPPPQLDIKSILLTNATVRFVRNAPDGSVALGEISNLNFAAANIRNGKVAKINFSVDIKADETPAQVRPNSPSSLLLAKFGGSLECGLTPDLMPSTVIGQISLDVIHAPDAFKELAGLHAGVDCTLTPAELTQFSFSLLRNDKSLGQISLSGPLDVLAREGKVKLVISGIDRQLLNFAGASTGIDFGSTTLGSTNQITLSSGGLVIAIDGRFGANKLSVAQKGAASKPLDLQMDYKLAINQADKTVLISAFNIDGTQDLSPLIHGALTHPATILLQGASIPDESAFELSLTNFNLADWRGFIGDFDGAAGFDLHLSSQAGKKINLDFNSLVTGFSGNAGGNKLAPADIVTTVHASVDALKKVQLDQFNFQILRQKTPALTLSCSGNCDMQQKNTGLDLKLDGSMADLAALVSLSGFNADSGSVKLTARITQNNLTPGNTNHPVIDQSVAGSLQLDNFSGQYFASRFDRFGGGIDFDAGIKNQAAEIRKFAGAFNQAGKSAGSFAIGGNYDLDVKRGEIKANILDLDQYALRPFLAPLLGNMTLSSANINVNATADYDAKGESTLQGEFKLADFLVTDPAGQLPKVPLTAEMKVDASMRDNTAKIGNFSGRINQGDQPGGRLDVTGNYDLIKQAGQVTLNITDVNQNALRPLLASKLGDKTLKSISISSSTTASYDPKGNSTVAGEWHLSNLIMTDPGNTLPKAPLATDFALDVLLRNGAAEIRNFTGDIKLGDARGGGLSLTGKYDLKKQSAQAAFKINGLNQNALAPFVGSALGNKKLTSVSINADATAAYDAAGESSVKGEFGVTNLIVADPDGKLPKTPLALGIQLGAGMTGQVTRLDQALLTWYDSSGRTQILIAGKVDATRSDAITGELQISSDSIALTPLYDLMTVPQTNAPVKNTAAPAPAAHSSTPAAASNEEPAPFKTPFQQFTVDARIKQLTLREVSVRDFKATALLNGGHLNLKPFQFTLNEAPVSVTADVNLEKPGYEYVLGFSADRLPLEPLVNTFAPAQRGHVRGDLIAKGDIKGAGFTGLNLKKSLSGQVMIKTDKANIELVSKTMREFLFPIAVLLRQPVLLDSPITYLNANVQMGGGVIKLTDFDLDSRAFAASSQGEIPIADVLTNSPLTNFPVHFALESSLAGQLGVSTKNAGTNNGYVQLPDFITAVGTLGKPSANVNKTTLAGTIALNKLKGQIPSLDTPSNPSLNTPSLSNPGLTTPTAPSVPSVPSVSAPSVTVPSFNPPIIR